jgi:2-polyprenyl-3-methyl-5-hydroxy-6-metoxy-1,4-benzoquinol methylase
METLRGNAADHENACARVAERFSKPWLRGYVRGKLRRDEIYPVAFELLRSSAEPILDVGCGVGLLAFYLRERGGRQPVLGVDVDARKIGQGSRVAEACYDDIEFRHEDAQNSLPEFRGNITLFDVLHYLPVAKQKALLSHLAPCVAPGGLLIIRDCPRDKGLRFWLTWLAEKFAQAISWNVNRTLHFPSRAGIAECFSDEEFDRESRPLWGSSPFNNHIFIFRRVVAGIADPGREKTSS